MSKYVVTATWDDVPHLSEREKEELLASIPPYQRDARSKGIPSLGSGAIYPLLEADITIADFELPDYYPRVYAMDVGWNRTAALWGAKDPESQVVYLYSEYYRGQAEPIIHADGIKSRGDWMTGVIDPAAQGRGQKDGSRLLQDYLDLGLHLFPSENSLEGGIYLVWQLLSSGKLKVFKSLQNWLQEWRLYRRDENGKIVGEDHLMDCTRYLVLSGREMMSCKPIPKSASVGGQGMLSNSWMG